MPKLSGAEDIIVEELEKGELSKERLSEIVKERAKLAPDGAKKTIDRHLYDLLKNRTIEVLGYDLSVIENRIGEMVKNGKIIRNVPAEGMVFVLLKLNHLDTLILIKNLETPNGVESLKKVKAIFKSKIRNMEDIKKYEWIKKENVVKSIPLKLFLEDLDGNNSIDINIFNLEIEKTLKEPDFNKKINDIDLTRRILKYEDLKEINEKNSKGKIMFFWESPIKSEIKLAKKKSYKIRQAAKLLTLSTKYFDENGRYK